MSNRDDRDDEREDLELPVLMLSMRQAAAMAQVGIDRVRDWTYEPDFPVIRTTHKVRIHARLFDEWLAKKSLERDGVAA